MPRCRRRLVGSCVPRIWRRFASDIWTHTGSTSDAHAHTHARSAFAMSVCAVCVCWGAGDACAYVRAKLAAKVCLRVGVTECALALVAHAQKFLRFHASSPRQCTHLIGRWPDRDFLRPSPRAFSTAAPARYRQHRCRRLVRATPFEFRPWGPEGPDRTRLQFFLLHSAGPIPVDSLGLCWLVVGPVLCLLPCIIDFTEASPCRH